MKNLIFAILLFAFYSCGGPAVQTLELYQIRGNTMGTTYSAIYLAESEKDLTKEIDILLKEINQETSTYIPSSTISEFNKSETGISFPEGTPGHFKKVFLASKSIWEATEGHFDPTVMPVVNYWGFGYTEKKPVTAVDSVKVDSLLQLIGFEKIDGSTKDKNSGNGEIYSKMPGMQLDFSAIAKGYAVDAVGELLESNGVKKYLVEIGGEVRGRGKNRGDNWWSVGISLPESAAGTEEIQNAVSIQNMAMATSGNYRNFYELNGIKYAHTINPETGFPAGNRLLSASVLTKDCMTADAFATAFMVMGLEKAYQMAENHSGIDAYFIYSDDAGSMQTKYTPGMSKYIAKK